MLDPVTLDQLRTFIAVAETGSFSAAARRLKRAQSAVSHSVMSLERALGVTLFDRSGHRPAMTIAGKALLPDARAVIARADAMKAHAHSIAHELEPELSLSTNGLLPNAVLIDALSACHRQFPQLMISLYTEAQGAVEDMVNAGTCLLGVTSRGAGESETPLVHQPLARIEVATVVAINHPLARFKGPVPTSELQRFPQLVLTDNSSHPECDRAHTLSDRPWRLADLESKRQFIISGFGWANLPLDLVQKDLKAGRLARIFPAEWGGKPFAVPLYLVYHRDRAPGRAAISFIGHLREALARAGLEAVNGQDDYAARRSASEGAR